MNPETASDAFKIVHQGEVPLIQATFYESEHLGTGAKHIHFASEDEANILAVIVPALPVDETGAPHILEHCVLSSGSKQYPDARSIGPIRATGSSAWTGWEYTWYFGGSSFHKDFLKLIDVRLASLLEPLLDEDTFLRQAHHLEFEDPEDPSSPLRIRGVIFNEQKGIFSMPLYVSWTEIGRGLLPGLPYALEHGGTSKATPTMTWQDLKDFHARHYHPANTYIITWGDIPLKDVQETLDTALARVPERPFERTPIPPLERFDAPRRHEGRLPIAAGEDPAGRGMILLSWITAPVTDAYEFLLHDVIAEVLIGSPSAPLRRALAESGLGKSVAETFDRYGVRYRDLTFCIGLQGADPADASKVESLIMDTLAGLEKEGIKSELIDAAINRIEFKLRTLQGATGGASSPTSLFIDFINTTWINGGDVLAQLNLEANISRLEEERKSGRPVEDRIRRWLLDNNHRALIVLEADPGADLRLEEEERLHLEGVKAKLTEDEKQQIVATALRLRSRKDTQEVPEETLEAKTELKVAKAKPLEAIRSTAADVSVESYIVRTNGITYIDLLADLGDLPDDLWDYMQLFSLALVRAGADGRTSDEMAAFIDSTTGGISASVQVPVDGQGERHRRLLQIGGRALERRQGDLAATMSTLLSSAEFTPSLVRGVASRALSQAEQGVFTEATAYLTTLAGSHVRKSTALRERLFGFTHLRLLRSVASAPDDQLEATVEKLAAIRAHVAKRGCLEVFVAASTTDAIDKLQAPLAESLSSLSAEGTSGAWFEDRLNREDLINEGRTIGLASAYNAEVIAVPGHDHPDAPAIAIAGMLMGQFIGAEVVRKGTAYHASCDAASVSGTVSCWSVRDPNIVKTYGAFAEGIRRLHKETIKADELNLPLIERSITVEPPGASLRQARTMFMESRTGLKPNRLLRLKESIAGISAEDIKRVAEEHLSPGGARATLASADMLETAQKEGLEFHVVSGA